MNFLAKIMAATSIVIKKQFIFLCLLLTSTICFGQEYGVIPSDVRAKMDSNKLIGIPTYTGIVTVYSVHCQGLENSELAELQSRAQNLSIIKEVIIQSNGVVDIICSGGTGFDQVKNIFSSLVEHITSITIDNRIAQ